MLRKTRSLFLAILLAGALPLRAGDALQWSGFALLRGSTAANGVPLDDDQLTAQLQLGLDWRPSMRLGGHLHLLARNDADGSRRGRAGVVEAYIDQNFASGTNRLRLTEGAFFLSTSRENIDALWESPYTITPSALNSWLGEEFRPIGVDAAYTWHRRWTGGVTVFRGNDTFGALPAVRGWALRDRWTLLGEHVPVDPDYYTSVSAETDHTLGWSARARWNNDHGSVQLTHIDNRSDALEHGELFNWNTPFDIIGADYSHGDWTVAAESGWGVTTIIAGGVSYPSDIRASYLLLSRRLGNGRASLRAEAFDVDDIRKHAITAAWFWTPRARMRAGVEAIASGGETKVSVELRYSFAGW
jgi:hypothetical protein